MAANPLFEKYGQTIEPGRVIFKEGEQGDRMYIIQEGTVRITKAMDNDDHVLAELTRGDFFGEMALVTRAERTASASAVDRVQLLAFDRAGFTSMIEKNAKIALNIIDKLCRRLQHANSQIQYLVRRNERSLIALNLYYRFREKEGEPVLTLDRAAEEISLSLELPVSSIREAISSLAACGAVRVDGNAIRLMDRNILVRLADEAGS